MKLDSSGCLWVVNSRNYLFRAIQHLSGAWELKLIAEVKGYLKSRIQGKLIRLSSNKDTLCWKINDNQLMRISTRSGSKMLLNVPLARPFDFICDFRINRFGDKICVLSRYGQIVIYLIQGNNYKILTKKFYHSSNFFLYKKITQFLPVLPSVKKENGSVCRLMTTSNPASAGFIIFCLRLIIRSEFVQCKVLILLNARNRTLNS